MSLTPTPHIGLKVRRLREALGLSVSELARQLGVSRRSLDELENCGDASVGTLRECRRFLRAHANVRPMVRPAPPAEPPAAPRPTHTPNPAAEVRSLRLGTTRVEHSMGGGPVVVSRHVGEDLILFGRGHSVQEAEGKLDELLDLYAPRKGA